MAVASRPTLHRRVLEMAKGVLFEAHGLSMDDATRLLRDCAHEHHRRLSDLAHAVVTVTDPNQEQLTADLGAMTLARLPQDH